MKPNPTTDAYTGLPAIASVVTVPGAHFMPLVEAMIEAAAWCIHKTGALFRS